MAFIIPKGNNYVASNSDVGDVVVNGSNLEITNIKLSEIKSAIGSTSNSLETLSTTEFASKGNKWALYKPGVVNLNASKQLVWSAQANNFKMSQWGGYNHQAQAIEPYDTNPTFYFGAVGNVEVTLVVDMGELQVDDPVLFDQDVDWLYIHDDNSTGTESLVGSASTIGHSGLILVTFNQYISTLTDQNINYFIWFGNTGAGNRKIWRPDSNTFTVTFDYTPVSYLRSILFSNQGLGGSTYVTEDPVDEINIFKGGATPTSWVLDGSCKFWNSGVQYTSALTLDLYARKNNGAWTLIRNNIVINTSSYIDIGDNMTEISIADNNDIIDILFIKDGETP